MRAQHVPGVAVAIVQGGKLISAKGYGESNVEHHVPVTPATIFQSGSVGKQFTAVAVMLLPARTPIAPAPRHYVTCYETTDRSAAVLPCGGSPSRYASSPAKP